MGGSSGLMDTVVGLVSTEATASEAGDPWSDGVMGSRFMIGCGWDVECGKCEEPTIGRDFIGVDHVIWSGIVHLQHQRLCEQGRVPYHIARQPETATRSTCRCNSQPIVWEGRAAADWEGLANSTTRSSEVVGHTIHTR